MNNYNNCIKNQWKLVLSLLALTLILFCIIIYYQNTNDQSITSTNLTTSTSTTIQSNSPEIIPRNSWTDRQPIIEPFLSETIPSIANRIIISHTGGNQCHTKPTCKQRLMELQNYHMDIDHLSDIRYNFVIGGDGNIYEGRGWFKSNPLCAKTILVGFIGNFTEERPIINDRKILDILNVIIHIGSNKGALIMNDDDDDDYIIGENQIEDRQSWDYPGKYLYEIIKKSYYFSDVIISCKIL